MSHEHTSQSREREPSSQGRRRRLGPRSPRAYNQGRTLPDRWKRPTDIFAYPTASGCAGPAETDAGAVAELKRAVEVARHGDSDETVDLMREEWALPRLDLERDVWLVEDDRGLAAYGFCWVEAPPGEIVAEQIVDPALRGRGLSELLLYLGEARAAELFRAAAPDRDGSLGVWSHESDTRRIALFERRGYERVRTFLRLDRDLGPAVEDPVWPAGDHRPGLPHRPRRGSRARGRRRGVPRPLPAVRDGPPGVDGVPLLARRPRHRSLVRRLGRRRGGRRRRSASRHPWAATSTSSSCAARGAAAVSDARSCCRPASSCAGGACLLAYLGVDSQNPTGAMHLYESAGFRSLRGSTFVYEKRLAAG